MMVVVEIDYYSRHVNIKPNLQRNAFCVLQPPLVDSGGRDWLLQGAGGLQDLPGSKQMLQVDDDVSGMGKWWLFLS